MNQITIGRNSQSTIVVSSQYNTVSGNHATITKDGSSYILEDHSTNGTYINGVRIHHASCQIRPGDQITLGLQYTLNFSEVQGLLGSGRQTQRVPATPETARVAPMQMPQNAPLNQQININVGGAQPGQEMQRETPQCLNKWNWGAFWLNWIWAAGNGVWWGLLALIPYVGFVVAIILGINGNSSAWEKFSGTAAEFDEKQRSWTKASWIILIVIIVISFLVGVLSAL